MKLLGPTPIARLNEAGGVVFLFLAIFLALALVSYHSADPSWNTSAGSRVAANLAGLVGSHLSDLLLQAFGWSAFLLPLYMLALAWKWILSRPIQAQTTRLTGGVLLVLALAAGFSIVPGLPAIDGLVEPGGIAGSVLAEWLVAALNLPGTVLTLALCLLLSIYLLSTFSVLHVPGGVKRTVETGSRLRSWWAGWRPFRWRKKAARRGEDEEEALEERARKRAERMARTLRSGEPPEAEPFLDPAGGASEELAAPDDEEFEIPIRTLDDLPPAPPEPRHPVEAPVAPAASRPIEPKPFSPPAPLAQTDFRLPPTDLLHEAPSRNTYDEQELKGIASAVKSKFEEFNVRGSVVQINHGPVVTTFEFKPEAGVKYSRITSLTDDLCLGLEAESILIERIPGKPTVGIEVPNSRREVISLRQVLESDEFRAVKSRLPVPLGKDVDGRIKVAAIETMPHLLIAGSTGSGKSVMLNSLLMSTLYRATPEEVRMIMVDPKRVELGVYEGIPHLLTPVITDPRKATNALRNAVIEMERRYRLLASLSVRNLDQYNRKVRKMLDQPRRLFPEAEEAGEETLRPLPFILIVIDELADLMMVERANVETSVARLSQMARAVGVHLVLATQRPSVDVITGLIKNNLPARISFRVATRFDSRTIIDTMGAERLLGKGDMLFLPPGSSRLIRMHGAFVDEEEITRVVDFWKAQAMPEYDETFLLAPPDEEGAGEDPVSEIDRDDPIYQDAVRVVLEMGKASTSILQRRLRIGYGRAARLLDIMQKDGIIGPPDGSRPREVLKAPGWLEEVEQHPR